MISQRGITLIETLAVLTLSTIVVMIGYSIYLTAMDVNQASFENTNLRNEAVLICSHFDKLMLNVDEIEIRGEKHISGHFHSFYAVDKRLELDKSSGQYQEITKPKTLIEIVDNQFLVDGERINSEHYSVKGSTFLKKNGDLSLSLTVLDPPTGKTFEISKLYHLQSE